MIKKFMNKIILFPFKILFSRFTLALLALLVQILFVATVGFCFQNYFVIYVGGTHVFSFILVISIMNRNLNSEFKTSWIIFILTLPTIGGLFYLFCQIEPALNTLKYRLKIRKAEHNSYLKQNEKIMNELKKENVPFYQHAFYLNQVGHFPIYYAKEIKYFKIGEEFYEDFLKKLKNAKKYIFLEFFIIANDSMWNQVLDILKEKVIEGVEVRVLYDGTCSFMLLPKDYPIELQKFGIQCKQFSPIVPLLSTHYNNRDHRKIVVIDGQLAYTGGCNLADEYINKYEKYGHWKDNMILFGGEAVNSFVTLFLEMWNLNEAKEKENYQKYFYLKQDTLNDGYIIPFGDDPYDDIEIGKNTYMSLLNRAKNKVDIVTPYFIVDKEFLNTLYYVSKKGIKIRLILPGIADKKLVNYLAKSYYKELLEYGIEIYEYTNGFTHLKVMIKDQEEAVMGTINLDYRSLYLHFEDVVLLYNVK